MVDHDDNTSAKNALQKLFTPRPGLCTCPECGSTQDIVAWPLLSKRRTPVAAKRLTEGVLFEYTCHECGYFDVLTYESVYFDEDAGAAIVFGRNYKNELYATDYLAKIPYPDLIAENPTFEVRKRRWVTHVDNLAEKALIFDCGLDDRAIEIAKLMVIQWMSGEDDLYDSSDVFFCKVLDSGNFLFHVSAIVDFADASIEFSREKYDEIEKDVKRIDPYDTSLVVDRVWAEKFLAEAAIREANDVLHADTPRYPGFFAKTTHDLQMAFDLSSMIGKRVVSIDVIGKMRTPTHDSLITTYVNFLKSNDESFWKKRITSDEIPLDFEQTRMIETDGPVIMSFEDGTSFEIVFGGPSDAFVVWGYEGERQPNREVNASRLLHQIIGERISSIDVIPAPEGSWEKVLADEEGCTDPFKYVLIRCEEHMLYMSWPCSCAVMPNSSRLETLCMTMQEIKDSISYYEELFD